MPNYSWNEVDLHKHIRIKKHTPKIITVGNETLTHGYKKISSYRTVLTQQVHQSEFPSSHDQPLLASSRFCTHTQVNLDAWAHNEKNMIIKKYPPMSSPTPTFIYPTRPLSFAIFSIGKTPMTATTETTGSTRSTISPPFRTFSSISVFRSPLRSWCSSVSKWTINIIEVPIITPATTAISSSTTTTSSPTFILCLPHYRNGIKRIGTTRFIYIYIYIYSFCSRSFYY